ncbi:MAG: alanine racemase [Gammaproteobacteria bacterium]|nr:MAG: alanine racemase [Gammaproteobacteria bacterium]
MSRPVLARIDLAALHHNLRVARRHAGGSRLLAVVKANAYGHGIARIAETLAAAGVDAFGVAGIEEALAIRDAGVRQPIVLLEGCFSPAEHAELVPHRLEPVIHALYQVEAFLDHPPEAPVPVWLKLDTGMHRLGLDPEAFARARELLAGHPAVSALRVLSHLCCADEPERPETERQLARFEACTQGLGMERSLANSAALVRYPAARYEWVRPGILLYGGSPLAGVSASALELRPVMTLETRIIAIRDLAPGEAVGYGAHWRATRPSRIGVAAIGYGDGYPRHAPEATPVLVDGERVPLVGRVSMDMITLDLTHHPRARLGDRVVLWGEGLPVEEVAQQAGTLNYELLCGVASRVHVRYESDSDTRLEQDELPQAG